jgi:hypothetical protein
MPTKTLRAGVTRWTVIRCECDEVFQFDSPCSDFELLAHLEEKGGAASLRLLTAAYGTKRARAYATHVRSWWKLTYESSGGIRVLTRSGGKPDRNLALQRDADLILTNAICCPRIGWASGCNSID